MAKGKRYTEDQILAVLREIDNGATIASVARAHGITDQTIYRWREKYAGMSGSELSELRALQAENQRPSGGAVLCNNCVSSTGLMSRFISAMLELLFGGYDGD